MKDESYEAFLSHHRRVARGRQMRHNVHARTQFTAGAEAPAVGVFRQGLVAVPLAGVPRELFPAVVPKLMEAPRLDQKVQPHLHVGIKNETQNGRNDNQELVNSRPQVR